LPEAVHRGNGYADIAGCLSAVEGSVGGGEQVVWNRVDPAVLSRPLQFGVAFAGTV